DDQALGAVGGQDEHDRLAEVVVDGPAHLDGVGDGGEVVVREDHVGRFLGGLSALDAHRHAHVGPFEGGGVVDAVAGHRDHLPGVLQRADQPRLVLGTGAGEHRVGPGELRGLLVARLFQLGAGDGAVLVVDAHLVADGGGGSGVVAGDHDDPDTGAVAGRDRAGGFRAG